MNRRFLAALALSCALTGPLSLAKSAGAQTSPGWTPAPLFTPAQITQATLPNGVRVVVKPTAGTNVTSVQVWVRGGSRAEKPSEIGLAHLIEVAAVTASANQPFDEGDGGLPGAMDVIGGDSGSLSSRDSTFYSATVANKDWGRALNALSDTVLRPDLSGANINRAKLIVANQLVGQVFNPVSQVNELAYRTAFPQHPYGHSDVGSENTLGALSAAKARAFYNRQYVGANISVVIVGDVTVAEAVEAAKRVFAPALKTAPLAVDPASGPLPADREASEQAPVSSEALALAWRSPGINKPQDVVATDALLALWREGLDANLRRLLLRDGPEGEQKPLVESYDVEYLTQRDSGLIIVTLVGLQDREATLSAIEGEIKRLSEQGPTEAEVKRARKLLHDQYVDQSASVAGQAGSLGFYEMIADYKFALGYEEMTLQVSAADIQRIARQYLAPDQEIRAEVTPLPRPRDPRDPDDIDGGDGIITTRFSPGTLRAKLLPALAHAPAPTPAN